MGHLSFFYLIDTPGNPTLTWDNLKLFGAPPGGS